MENKSTSYGTFFLLYCGQDKKAKGVRTVDYSIVWVRGHVEVYDHAGRFCFSADNEREALEELDIPA